MADLVDFFTDGTHWSGADGIPNRLAEHVGLTLLAVLIAAAIALPIGVWLGHLGRGGTVAINISNVGRAVPTFGVLVLLATSFLGIGNRPALVALVLFAIPPILTNTYVGMTGVDRDVKEAARGMGMTGGQLLRSVEVPLALPLVMAGLRTAAVQVVATATLAAVVAGGTLGRFIVDGLAQQDETRVLAGALLVALLALVTELSMAALQRAVTPGSGRRRRRTASGGPRQARGATVEPPERAKVTAGAGVTDS